MESMKQLAQRLINGPQFVSTHGGHIRVECPPEWQQLAAAYLSICDQVKHAPDDGEPADNEWAESVGARRTVTGQMVLMPVGVEIRFTRDVLFIESTFCKRYPTRGDIKRICNSLGHHLREKASEMQEKTLRESLQEF